MEPYRSMLKNIEAVKEDVETAHLVLLAIFETLLVAQVKYAFETTYYTGSAKFDGKMLFFSIMRKQQIIIFEYDRFWSRMAISDRFAAFSLF